MSKISQCVPFGHYTALINQKNGPKDNANLFPEMPQREPSCGSSAGTSQPQFFGGLFLEGGRAPSDPSTQRGAAEGHGRTRVWPPAGLAPELIPLAIGCGQRVLGKALATKPHRLQEKPKNEVKNEVIQPLLIPPCLFSPSFGSVCQPTV